MGAKRVQQHDIIKMNELYLQIGTYAGVAREVGFSAGTVKRYIQEDYIAKDQMEKIEYIEFNIPSMKSIKYPNNWNDFLKLTDEEKIAIKELQKTILL